MTNFSARPVFIDISCLMKTLFKKTQLTGIGRVCLAYLRHYENIATGFIFQYNGRIYILSKKASTRLFNIIESPTEQLSFFNLSIMIIKDIFYFKKCANLNGAFVLKLDYHAVEDKAYLKAIKKNDFKMIYMVHDLLPISHPEFFLSGESKRHQARLDSMLKTASGILLNSYESLNQLREYALEYHHCMPSSIVAHLAPGHLLSEPLCRPISSPYFVMIGTIEPRKNHSFILLIWRRLVEIHGSKAPRLVIIGQRGWECENTIDLLERCEQLRGYVFESSVDDHELTTYLYHAQALLFPTFQEGFGMPVIEALAKKVPVIASDLPVFREFAGEVPEYIDPLDGLGWLNMIDAYSYNDSDIRQSQLRRMLSCKLPTWAEHFEKIDAFINK